MRVVEFDYFRNAVVFALMFGLTFGACIMWLLLETIKTKVIAV